MLFKIAPEVLRDYPGVFIGVIVAHNIDNTQSSGQVKELLQQAQDDARTALTPELIANHPHIVPWLKAYTQFGANPKKYIPSVKNLADRILKKGVPSINPLVDLYNVIALKYLLPTSGKDLAAIQGDIELALAEQEESAVLVLGDKEPTKPERGEVLYKDARGALGRRWNWKEADRSKLTTATHDAFLVLEGLPPVDTHTFKTALYELAELIERHCGGTVSIALLNAQKPEITLAQAGAYTSLDPLKKVIPLSAVEIYNKVMPEENSTKNESTSNEHAVRVDKVHRMRAAGFEPWPAGSTVNTTTKEIIASFDLERESRVYQVSGRILSRREHGKTAFITIQDRTGKVQVYIKKDDVGVAAFERFSSFVDIGDIVWVNGTSFQTKTGEITIKATDVVLQSKCLHPLPEKFHGLHDIETAYRQRYLDLISNTESRARFVQRSLIVKTIRNFLDASDFIEVETPMLQVIPGGAAARPFVTHHNTLDIDLYLRIAPELYLKRLVVGGFERVYEVNRNFRNEGISTKHNPEFTMLEFYIAYKDYHFAMDLVEKLIRTVTMAACQKLQVPFGKHILDFEKPFTRMSMRDAVKQYGKLSEEDLSDTGIDRVIERHAVHIANKQAAWGHKLYALFETFVEPHLVQPTFITDFPIEVSPLAKRDAHNPSIAARFELFIAGVELSNGFNELNDPFDQAARFMDQARDRSAGDIEAHHYDADYVQALEYALPPTAGVGIGIDRLTMFLTNTTSIKDVILFPTLKKKE